MASLAHTTRRPSHVRTASERLPGRGWRHQRTHRGGGGGLPVAGHLRGLQGLSPFGGSSNDAGAAYLNSNASGPPTAAATALGGGSRRCGQGPGSGCLPRRRSLVGRLRRTAGVKASGGDGSFRGGSAGGGTTGPGDPGDPRARPVAPRLLAPAFRAPHPFRSGTADRRSAHARPAVVPVPDPPGGVNPPPVNVVGTQGRRAQPPSLPNAPSFPARRRYRTCPAFLNRAARPPLAT